MKEISLALQEKKFSQIQEAPGIWNKVAKNYFKLRYRELATKQKVSLKENFPTVDVGPSRLKCKLIRSKTGRVKLNWTRNLKRAQKESLIEHPIDKKYKKLPSVSPLHGVGTLHQFFLTIDDANHRLSFLVVDLWKWKQQVHVNGARRNRIIHCKK